MALNVISSLRTLIGHTRVRAHGLRYDLHRLLSFTSLRCDCSLMQFASDNSLEPLLLADSDWLVRVESDNARISSRISASPSGGLGGVLINVTDAADLRFCLLLLFLLTREPTL